MTYTIETTDLTKNFGRFTAVDRVSMQVAAGEIYGFLGPNGAGKTTAIRMLCGLLAPSSGQGRVAGFDIMKKTSKIRTRIGYMSQKFSLYTDLSVRDNMMLYGALYGLNNKQRDRRIEEMTAFLHMEQLLSRNTGSLPWGWQQRISLACANLHEPEILFLDEPTGSVDPVSRQHFWDLIRVLSLGGTTIFVTTHHMDEAEYCGRVSLMVDGAIAAVDSPAELKKRYACDSLHEAFIRATREERSRRAGRGTSA
ncbi:MAG: ATP-binding cassette domain-containing protein [Chitinivibrionales bacterium]|nr:ATP-binding cassette domain-containing protein [Chitinivibrionales bacterium]MBD3396560.1 ATP-binding cassette domain-containing protein [Chitinivibrionales bacterium]